MSKILFIPAGFSCVRNRKTLIFNIICKRRCSSHSPNTVQNSLGGLPNKNDVFGESQNLVESTTETFKLASDPYIINSFNLITPVDIMNGAINLLHYNAGLPWWASIVSLGVLTKALCLPFYLQTQKSNSLSQLHKIKLNKWNDLIQSLYSRKQIAAAKNESEKLKNWRTEHGFPSAFKTIGNVFITILVSLSAFLAIQQLCSNDKIPSLFAEKFGWMVLSQPDPTLLLPFLSTLFLVINIGFSLAFGASSALNSVPLGMKLGMYGVCFGSLYFTKDISSGLMLYFTTVNLLTIIQVLAFRLSFIRKRLHLIPLDKIKKENMVFSSTKSSLFGSALRNQTSAFRATQVQQDYTKKPAPPKAISDLEKLYKPTVEGYNFK